MRWGGVLMCLCVGFSPALLRSGGAPRARGGGINRKTLGNNSVSGNSIS